VLNNNTFDSYATHLAPEDRPRAREQLDNQRRSLVDKVTRVLRQAYGLAQKQSTDVVLGYDEHLLTLVPGFKPTLPPGAPFTDALRSITDQLLDRQFPDHPDFDPERTGYVVKQADVKIVLDGVRKAVESGDGRAEIEQKPHRAVIRRIAEPLKLGTMGEAVLTIGRHWTQQFEQRAGRAAQGELRVSELLEWLDPEPHRLGLDPLVAQLVIAAYAEQTNRSFFKYGGPVVVEPPQIKSEFTLRLQPLPTDDEWDAARERSYKLFGVGRVGPPVARLVRLFVEMLAREAQRHRDDAHQLVNRLEQHADVLGLDIDAREGRLATARHAADVIDMIVSSADGVEIIKLFAQADLGGPAERVRKSLSAARTLADVLRHGPWEQLSMIRQLSSPFDVEAKTILAQLSSVARDDELTRSLAPALGRAKDDAVALINRAIVMVTPPPPPPPKPPAGGGATVTRTVASDEIPAVLDELREAARQHPDKIIEIAWTIR